MVIDFESEAVRMSLADEDLFGKCDDSMEFMLPTSLKDALRRKAAERRMSMGALIRMELAKVVHGDSHVLSLVAARVMGNPGGTRNITQQ